MLGKGELGKSELGKERGMSEGRGESRIGVVTGSIEWETVGQVLRHMWINVKIICQYRIDYSFSKTHFTCNWVDIG